MGIKKAEILGRSDELGTLTPGKLGDVLVVEGDVMADIAILQDRKKLIAVLQGGVVKSERGVSCLRETVAAT
jgi:imidazolonepropionase-like amidohydrolase